MARIITITVKDLPPWDRGGENQDGVYKLDVEGLTNLELRRIKVISGIRAGEIPEASGAGDSDLMLAFTCVAIEQTLDGKQIDSDELLESKVGTFHVDFSEIDKEDEETAVADPQPGDLEIPVETDSPTSSSGVDSDSAGDSNPSDPSPTGDQSSEPSESGLETSES